MKKSIHQLFIKQILLTLLLTTYNPTHGMDLAQSIKSFVFSQLEGQSYIIGKYFVMIAQAINLHLALFAYQLSPQARALGLQIAINQLKLLEQNLKDAEQKAINDLFAEFKIDTEAQSLITSWINQTKEYTAQHYQSPTEDAIHDPKFPSDIFSMLENNNINARGIDLKLNSDNNQNYDARAGIAFINFINSEDDPSKKTLSFTLSPCITLFTQRYFAHPAKSQKALLIHEVEHLTSMNGIAPAIIKTTMPYFANKSLPEIINSKHYKELDVIIERQAEIFPAIRSAQDAEILACSRYCGNYPGYLHLGHLLELTEIENLHHFIEKLKNQKLNIRIPHSQSPQRQFPQKPKVVPVDRISATAQQLATE